MQSVSGLMSITGEVGGAGAHRRAISDFSSGLFGLAGVLAALFARERFPKDSTSRWPCSMRRST
jgi:crotonobetainyl-CoA:carnitine CoA-transferase CaiB-like acyl-CoA transferase